MKNLIKKILKESSNERFYKIILDNLYSGKIKRPYFKYLKNMGLERYEIIRILQKFFNGIVYTTNDYSCLIKDKNGNMVYHEDQGFWEIWEYDEYGNIIYQENSRRVEIDER